MESKASETAAKVRITGDWTVGDGVRMVAVEADGGWPAEVLTAFYRAGIGVEGRTAGGFRRAFAAALLRWPKEHADLGRALAGLLELDLGFLAPMEVGGRQLPVDRRTIIMGVLNVTPDSFYDGGRYVDVEAALRRAEEMIAEGADVIDVGGESTRPGADPVPEEEELRRVIPVISRIARSVDVPISIDTYKARVAKEALEAGATIVNDITGLHRDPDMAKVAADYGASVVIMHSKGDPKTMQLAPQYEDLIGEVRAYLEEGCERAIRAGVRPDRIWIDPGIGFGKTAEHNLELLRSLREFRTLGFPILVGTSNKSVIGRVLGLPVDDRVEGTAATVAAAIAYGADGVRVHDVRVMQRVSRMTDAIVRARGVE